jgi:hypothetical protein
VPHTEALIGIADITRGGSILLRKAVYRLTRAPDGRITGSIKAPSTERLHALAKPGPRLQLQLEDGATVSFFMFRAQTAPGGWGDIEGRIEPASAVQNG